MRIPNSNRGSVLVVALLFSAVIAISLASYLRLSVTSARLSQRSFYANAAMNLVDTGLEQALWSLNHSNWTGAGFSQNPSASTQWQGSFPLGTDPYYHFAQGVKGQVKVWVDLSNATRPHVVAETQIILGDGSVLRKMAETFVQTRSYFANGLVAKQDITFSGNNAQVDSWNSDPDNNPSTPAVPFSSSVAHDDGRVGCTSVQVDSISVSNANIYGFVAIGANTLAGITVGPRGLVGPYGTPENGTIDPTHVTYDFTTSFPDQTGPTPAVSNPIGAISGSRSLPGVGDHVNPSDDTYYYTVPSISLSGGSDTLSIGSASSHAKVVIIVQNSIGETVSVTGGGAGISIASGSSLALYTAGDVKIAGNGVVNGSYNPAQPLSATNAPNPPVDFQLFGTRPTESPQTYQNIKIAGNGYLSGVVYAPNASVELKGGGSSGQVLGAAVANTVSITGNSIFHYDESLANFGGSSLWGLTKWRELTSAADRSAVASSLDF